ncbi:MAG: CDP-diacylglycerol--serine O-phosphatidyltransferase [Candidatus Aenigmarchaeota archaeon]|nr:CDP-diacylglycerol--serine O-phosphatidyltransferase [Candidatus Aenigmarchaeota archaeon]
MNMLKLIKTADLVSLLNALFGFLGILLILNNKIYIAIFTMLISLFLDTLDGKISRVMKNESEFGKNVDSLSDIISFGAVSACLCYKIIGGWTGFSIGGLLLLCGVLRLARYNILSIKDEYIGLPITTLNIIFPALYFLKILNPVVIIFVSVICSILMVSNIRIKKIRSEMIIKRLRTALL